MNCYTISNASMLSFSLTLSLLFGRPNDQGENRLRKLRASPIVVHVCACVFGIGHSENNLKQFVVGTCKRKPHSSIENGKCSVSPHDC